MMKFGDIFKKSFLSGFSGTDLSLKDALIALLITFLIAIYIFAIYRIITRKDFYDKNFNISLPAIALITAAIIITIQSSIVVSLGMVGALSIVRFRTAVKNPLDLVCMFWAISVGIICGAGLFELALILSVMVTIMILLLDWIPVAKASMILVLQMNGNGNEKKICEIIAQYTNHYKIKSRKRSKESVYMVIELKCKEESKLLEELSNAEGMLYTTLMEHDGEVTF